MKPTFDERSLVVFTMITFAWFLVDQLSYPVPGHLSLTCLTSLLLTSLPDSGSLSVQAT